MAPQPKTIAAYVAAVVLRLSIFYFFPNIISVLIDRVEISTPISSYKRLLEGLFLFERGVSPYDGGVFHQAPLLLVIFEILPPAAIFTLLDVLNAHNLTVIANKLRLPTPRFQKLDETQIATAYLFNPFTILSCLGSSTTLVTNAAVIQAVASAAAGNAFGAMFAIALGTYLSLYPALLLPPLILYWAQSKAAKLETKNTLSLLSLYAGMIAILLLVSTLLVGDLKNFISSCYGAQISVTDLTPNIGLWWYFFIEIFDAFRSFFIGVFWIHLVGYVGALTVRLPEQPLFVIIALLGLVTIFKPYPSTSDVSLYLGVLPLYKHVMPLTRYTFLAASVLLYSSLLGPAFYQIWIYAGSGNANFFYAITLVWSLGLSMLVGDSLFAVLRDEWEMLRPEMRGKEVRQI
ncbi:hypothetical protein LTR05_006708 [Lithohypha guttulata]|uniref:Uncharacterized protein n=1 Tax=Lithohypha guttulata TaxID=1690604 RepID=A0AAN7SVP4_9EURO|nr:hypothetical protein LTR05_006708 [Lithohypha guttulata]